MKIKPKGQIFLMSLLILSAVLILGLTLIIIFTRDLRQAIETPESIKAFYAADSAMEWQLYNTFNDPDVSSPQMRNRTSYEFKNEYEANGSIKTIGISKNVRRGIEVYFK
jgi:hypothetical protein